MIYSEYKHTTDVIEKLFSLFSLTWRTDLKMFTKLIPTEQMKASKNVKQDLFTSTEKKKPRSNCLTSGPA